MNAKMSVILAMLILLPLSESQASPISDQGPAGGSAPSPSQAEPVSGGSLLDAVPIGIEGAPVSDGINLPLSTQSATHAVPDVDAAHPDAPFGFSADSLFSSGESPTSDRSVIQDPNLKQVLRSIATVHRSNIGDASSHQSGVENPGIQTESLNGGQEDLGFSHIILDSPVAASVLREVIDLKSTSDRGTVFSIFGMGQYMLETIPGTHVTTLSELSSGRSVTLLSDPDDGGQDGYNQNAANANERSAPVVDNSSPIRRWMSWVVDFVTSPLAILLAMIVIVIMALWGTVRTIASLRMQAAMMRHQQLSARRSRSRGRSKAARRSYPSRQLRPPA